MTHQERILEISKKHKLSHIGSCLSVLPILEDIFKSKQPEDKVILDNGHAALALYVMLEDIYGLDAEKILKHHSIHPDRCVECHLDSSSGSLGHGLGIAIGMVLGGVKKIHVVVSDGSIMEGSNWEALRYIGDNELYQIHIYCNFNGYTAVESYNTDILEKRMKVFVPWVKVYHTNNGEGFDGVQGHYKVII